RPIRFLAFLALPAVRLLTISTEAVVKLLGLKTPAEPPVTEEEVKIMIEQGAAAGVFEREEETMMKRVLCLGDQSVGSIMTQRIDVIFLDADAPFDDNLSKMLATPHSYFPIYRESQDDVIGLVSTKDVLSRLAEARAKGEKTVELLSGIRDPLFVAESMPV